jgi:hypothetical protein
VLGSAQRGLCGRIGIDDSSFKIGNDDAIDSALLDGFEFLVSLGEVAIAFLQITVGLVEGVGQVLLFGLGCFVGLIDRVYEIAQVSWYGIDRSKEPVELAQKHAVHRTLSAAWDLFLTRGISPLPSSFIGVKDGLL